MLEGDPKFNDFATIDGEDPLEPYPRPCRSREFPRGGPCPVRDVLIYSGAKFLCPVAGTITLMQEHRPTLHSRRVRRGRQNGKGEGIVLGIARGIDVVVRGPSGPLFISGTLVVLSRLCPDSQRHPFLWPFPEEM